jgi:tetratricopeptide (TPR) repeat protein
VFSRAIAIIVFLLRAALPIDAATLKGVVLANELSGPPMENIEVDAISGANHTESDSSGKFTLEFPQRRAGDTVRILVKKEGYVVVNDVQLQLALPADADAAPLMVILAKEQDREEMARRFYRLKSFDAIEETYRKRVKELEDTQQATAAELTKLQQERYQARAAAAKASEQLAKNGPGQSSGPYQEAKRLFLDGKIDEAIKLLNDEELRQSLVQAKKAITDVVQAWLLKAQMLTVQFRFDAAEEAYKSAVELAKKSQNDSDLATTLNNLEILDRARNRVEEAGNEYGEALKIFRELAQKNPDVYLPSVADTLNNLGILDIAHGRREEARNEYNEDIGIGH